MWNIFWYCILNLKLWVTCLLALSPTSLMEISSDTCYFSPLGEGFFTIWIESKSGIPIWNHSKSIKNLEYQFGIWIRILEYFLHFNYYCTLFWATSLTKQFGLDHFKRFLIDQCLSAGLLFLEIIDFTLFTFLVHSWV